MPRALGSFRDTRNEPATSRIARCQYSRALFGTMTASDADHDAVKADEVLLLLLDGLLQFERSERHSVPGGIASARGVTGGPRLLTDQLC
jgi:hypothetical protein